MIEDDSVEYIEEIGKSYHSNDKYRIEALFDVSRGKKSTTWMDVTGMFGSLEEMEEAYIPKSRRKVVASNEEGYGLLIRMGFSKKEIVKEF